MTSIVGPSRPRLDRLDTFICQRRTACLTRHVQPPWCPNAPFPISSCCSPPPPFMPPGPPLGPRSTGSALPACCTAAARPVRASRPRPRMAAWRGLRSSLCRAIAAAVLGDGAKIEFHPYTLGQDFERLRRGDDAVAFLTGSELLANSLLDAVVPGPAVFHQTNGVMVRGRKQGPAPGRPREHHGLRRTRHRAGAHAAGLFRQIMTSTIRFSGWQEEEEMLDAFEVGRCPAVALETTALAAQRADGEARGHPIRILPEPLSASPVLAVSGLDDARWAAVIAWTMQTSDAGGDAAELPPRRCRFPGSGLGLTPGWQARATAAGTYADIAARNLGMQSPLRLPPALDASWRDGGLLCPPRSRIAA